MQRERAELGITVALLFLTYSCHLVMIMRMMMIVADAGHR